MRERSSPITQNTHRESTVYLLPITDENCSIRAVNSPMYSLQVYICTHSPAKTWVNIIG